MEQINWDSVFNVGKNQLLSSLSSHKIDPTIATKYGKPLMDSLYGLKPYLISDASKTDKISPNTQQYINKVIIPSLNKSIESYWDNLGYVKKQTFKVLSRGNDNKIKGTLGSLLLSLVYGFNSGLDKLGVQNSNLYSVIDDLTNYMGHDSNLSVSALHKIKSLS